jgi:energy-coupling factor transporter ATP-binding protein EcfA2
MIGKIAKMFLVGGMGLFLLLTACFALAGVSWGMNGVVVSIAALIAVGLVGTVILIWILGAAESLFLRFALVWQALRRIRAETEKQEFAADYYQINHPVAGAVAVDRNGRMIRLDPAASKPKDSPVPEQEPEDDGPEIAGPLLPILEGMSRILLIGGMGAGKTELLRHLAWAKAQQDGHVIICDSHASPTTWPNFVQVAGIGRNYEEIEGAVNYVCEELDNRYKLRASGEQKRFEQLTLVVDELFVLNQFCDLRQQFKSLLAESRKVNIGLIVAGQSDRAGALGLTGNKDLVAGFEACVYLERLDNGQRVGFIRSSNRRDGKYYLHPGPFRGRGGGASGRWSGEGGRGNNTHTHTNRKQGFGTENEPFSPCVYVPMTDIDADGRNAEIIEQYRQGNSISAIMKKVFGHRGGAQADQIKNILRRYGIA